MLDEAGYTKGADGIRTMPDGGRKLLASGSSAAAATARHRSTSVQYVAGLAQADRHRGQASRSCPRTPRPRSSATATYDLFEWGWVVEPDPDYQLSTFTCASARYKDGGTIYADLSDCFYCNQAYDALYAAAVGDDRPRQARARSSSRCRRCSTRTRRTS